MTRGRAIARRAAGRRGVSLIEVLAALALIAAVAPVLSRAWVLTMTVAGQSADEVTAAALAESKLAEIVAAEAPATAEDSGAFAAPHEDFHWQVERGPWPQDERMIEAEVTVTWTRRGQEQSLAVHTLVGPEES